MSKIEQAAEARSANPKNADIWKVAIAFVAAALAAVIIAIIFTEGLRRGMDHKTAFGPESEQAEISIALSETVYGLKLGYIGFATVHDKLVDLWNSGLDGHDPKLIDNCSDRDLLNKAIAAASSLGPQTVGYVGNHTLISAVYDDLGYVDFTKLSFSIFGRHIEALYYTFFTLLSISSLVFVVTFFLRIDALTILLCSLFAFVIEMHTSIFIPDMPTVVGMRHSSTLAFIPLWHFLFLILHRRRLSLGTGVGALLQLAILVLAVRIRGSAMWGPLLIVGTALAMAFVLWLWQQQRPRSLAKSARSTTWWPAAVVIGGLLANSVYMAATLHPVYGTDDVIPYHGLWHSAVLGFTYEPNLYSKEGREARNTVGGDSIGYAEALNYLSTTHFLPPTTPGEAPIGYISPWTGTLKMRFHDNIMRHVFFSAIFHHPFLSAKLYLYDKFDGAYDGVRLVFQRTEDPYWSYWLIAGGTTIGIFMALGNRSLRDWWTIAAVCPATLLFAALPNMWAYSSVQTIADLFLTVLMVMTIAVALFTCAILISIQLLARGPISRLSLSSLSGH
jgi:hypothetical protein